MQTHTRSVYRVLGMLAVLGWQTASAVEVSWTRQPGSATYIASNASASLWMIGTDSTYTNGTATLNNSSTKTSPRPGSESPPRTSSGWWTNSA